MAKKAKAKKKVIIFNHMFTGDYLFDSNIGHEVINLFKADKIDEDNHYIYLCNDGEYDDSSRDAQYVMQVRRPHHSVRTLEVVSIAEIDGVVTDEGGISYGGHNVKEIFAGNKKQQTKCATFKVKKIIKPNEPVYIFYHKNPDDAADKTNVYLTETTEKTDKDGKPKFRFNISRILREYFNEGSEDYNTLNAFCEQAFAKEEEWNSDFKTISEALASSDNGRYSPIPADIYGIGTWELAYSNAFKYFMDNNKKFLEDFCDLCWKNFGNSDKLAGCKEYNILREWNHIDLLIEYIDQNDKKYAFVIENKIFSDLNGKDKCQLKNYKDIMEKKIENTYEKHEKIYILLTPNHNKVRCDEGWKRVLYSEVYKIIENLAGGDIDFEAFKSMISLHKEDDFHYAVMKRCLAKRLAELETNKSNIK